MPVSKKRNNKPKPKELIAAQRAERRRYEANLIPLAEILNAEKIAMVEKAMYHVLGDVDLEKSVRDSLFVWHNGIHKHPMTNELDLKRRYLCLIFTGDQNEEYLVDKKDPVMLIWQFMPEPKVIMDSIFVQDPMHICNNWKLLV